MNFEQKLQKFSELIVKIGVNLQPGEQLVINTPIECADFAHKLAEEGYKAGAKSVRANYLDEKLSKITFTYADSEAINDIPAWKIAERESVVDQKACYISIYSEDPELYAGIDPNKVTSYQQTANRAFKRLREASMNNEVKWCVMSVPSVAWAKKVFPDLPEKKAVEQLWKYIFKTMRLDKANPVAAWETHQNKLQKRCRYLNRQQFKCFKYKNAQGTDITVEMPENYLFFGGSENSAAGCPFAANMPTEEVFSAPHRLGVNGKLVSALPLCHNGNLIENFWLTFKDGKVADFGAEKGYETLKGIIESDEGSCYLGEIALVGFDNPIRNLNTLFYNTLFDENASCHFALGQSYTCVKGCEEMSKEQLLARGLNQSTEHVDFMIGTADLSITAVRKNGEEVAIFKDGNFVI